MLKQRHHNFFTVGFKSLRFLCVTKRQKTPQLWCLLFFWPTRSTFCVFSTFYLAYCGLFTANFHQRSSLKTVHRTVFLTVGFKSLRFLCVTKKQKTPQLWCLLFFGPPEVLFAFFLLSTSPTAACSQQTFINAPP